MNNKNLLYLNLALDDEDVSLGFANTWIKQFSNKFENVDIITLNKSNENIENENSSQFSNDENKLSDEIEKLNKLLKDGVLTQEEFEKAKKKLLDD